MRERVSYSLIGIFGALPVHPDIFSTLDPKLKHLARPLEGDSFCVTCGTLQPQVPREHHPDCFSYKDADEFEEWVNPLGECRECGGPDLQIDSSREQKCSVITCPDCSYQYGAELHEEALIEKFMRERTLKKPKRE